MSEKQAPSIREYVDIKLAALEYKIENNRKSSDERISLATSSLDKRLEGMNEFRQTLNDQSKSFFTRPEHEFFRQKIESDMSKATDKNNVADCRIEDLVNQKVDGINLKLEGFEKF